MKRWLVCALVLTGAARISAWGPHSEITRAACRTVPEAFRLNPRLVNAEALAEYCWMADYREHAFPHYFADDYLLFPSLPRHLSHMLPEVRATYAPHWKRALQALRTESPTNAARWVGSLLHFVQDSGSPPHTAGISGELHFRMENWIDSKAIDLRDYTPQLLGDSDESALTGFQRRMEELVAYSRQRAERVRPLCEANRRAEAEPIILESALETARVTADVVTTLLTRAPHRTRPTAGAALTVRISAPPLPALPRSPARLVLLRTDYATVAEPVQIDEDGYRAECTLRDLPPGRYRPLIYRAGAKALTLRELRLAGGEHRELEVNLEADRIPGNLLRDPDRRVSTVVTEVLDHWQRVGTGESAVWRTTATAVEAGARYRIGTLLHADARATVRVRWDHFTTEAALRTDTLASDGERFESVLAAPERALNVRLLIVTDRPLESVLRHVWIVKEAPQVREFQLRYLRPGGALEAELTRQRTPEGVITTSMTHRGNLRLKLNILANARDELHEARVVVESSGMNTEAVAAYRDGQLTVRQGEQSLVFPSGPRLIVTSAPDWTDTVMLCQRYDRERRGIQSFPALWFHPTQPPQLLNFTAERMNGDTLTIDGQELMLDKLILTIRGGSRYLAWTKSDGTMVKLVPINRSGFAQDEQAIYLQGFEQHARDLR